MPLLGTDEAGFGPNLGPLVIVATAWDTTAADSDALRDLLVDVASSSPDQVRLHLADSKAVHVTGKPLASSPLARAARGILAAAGVSGTSLRETITALDIEQADPIAGVPWFERDSDDTPPPEDSGPAAFATTIRRLGIGVRVAADVIPAAAYNDLLDQYGSKGQLLSRRTLRLLRRLWTPGDDATIVCDKHGGRDKYGPLLQECVLDMEPSAGSLFGPAVETLAEGRLRSQYRIGRSHLTFEQKAEAHVQVACASIIAKWLRERTVDAFNAYWTRHQPDLKPTRGYPNDAVRWRNELRDCEIDERTLWRRK